MRTKSAVVTGALLIATLAASPSPAAGTCPGFADSKLPQIVGTSGGDKLTGTNKAEIICGKGGYDELFGRGGEDVILGGADRDVVLGEGANDLLKGGRGSDILDGGDGARDVCLGGPGDDGLAPSCESGS
jgi:Ca2+-binding RTX toxin-like protein